VTADISETFHTITE